MNRQSNSYTIIYSIILVLLTGIVLSVVYQSLKPMQDENIANDKKKQILSAALIAPSDNNDIARLYSEHIKESFCINHKGQKIESSIAPFDINVAEEVGKPMQKRKLPVFVCTTTNGNKYIIPVYGAGLWGPIWGYVAFNEDGNTIFGAYFAHQGETPGLGAEIEKPKFQKQFERKTIFNTDGTFESIAVVKNGQEPSDKEYVHAISGGTITSQGVQKMLFNSLEPYAGFLKNLSTSQK